jgi:hypothetical protein
LIKKHLDKAYVNAELFEDYLRSAFLPHLMITRLVKDPREEDAVFLMDHCSSHITSHHITSLRLSSNFFDCPCARGCRCFRTATTHHIPHTTYYANLPCSRSDFLWRSERTASISITLDNDAGSARFIKKVYHDHDFRMTTTTRMIELNIWGAQ